MGRLTTLCLALIVMCVQPASAQDQSALQSLETADKGKAWQAVGRLNFGQRSFCSAALIAPDLVLTAAHCLFDQRTGKPHSLEEIEFLAGWRNGRAEAYRGVRQGVVHPRYEYGSTDRVARVAYDLALLQLARDIRLPGVAPFTTSSRPRKGDEVGVVSYARNRAEAPSLQRACQVLAGRPGVLMMSCDVDHGASGAPVFSFREGFPQIVSVVSAMADTDGGRRISLGVSLGDKLELLHTRLAAGEGLYQPQNTRIRRFGQGSAKSDLGAKFLRP